LASLSKNKNVIFFDIRNNEIGDKELEDAIHDTVMNNYLESRKIPLFKKPKMP